MDAARAVMTLRSASREVLMAEDSAAPHSCIILSSDDGDRRRPRRDSPSPVVRGRPPLATVGGRDPLRDEGGFTCHAGAPVKVRVSVFSDPARSAKQISASSAAVVAAETSLTLEDDEEAALQIETKSRQ